MDTFVTNYLNPNPYSLGFVLALFNDESSKTNSAKIQQVDHAAPRPFGISSGKGLY